MESDRCHVMSMTLELVLFRFILRVQSSCGVLCYNSYSEIWHFSCRMDCFSAKASFVKFNLYNSDNIVSTPPVASGRKLCFDNPRS